jgi:hypothetical protein
MDTDGGGGAGGYGAIVSTDDVSSSFTVHGGQGGQGGEGAFGGNGGFGRPSLRDSQFPTPPNPICSCRDLAVFAAALRTMKSLHGMTRRRSRTQSSAESALPPDER